MRESIKERKGKETKKCYQPDCSKKSERPAFASFTTTKESSDYHIISLERGATLRDLIG
jgi:hypothetical protein